jgi:hypothetical protein
MAAFGIFGLAALALWVFCVFDVISTEESLARNLPKTMWLLIVIFVPTVGSIAWLALGRPINAGYRPGDTTSRPTRRVYGPEDDPGWSTPSPAPSTPAPSADPRESADARERRLMEREAELARREQELEQRERGDADPDA